MKKYLFIILLVGVCFGQEDSLIMISYSTIEYNGDNLPAMFVPIYENYLSYDENALLTYNLKKRYSYPFWPDTSISYLLISDRINYSYENNQLKDSTIQNYYSGLWWNQTKWEKQYDLNFSKEYDFDYNSTLNVWDTLTKRIIYYDSLLNIDSESYFQYNQLQYVPRDSIKNHYINGNIVKTESFQGNIFSYPFRWDLNQVDSIQYDQLGNKVFEEIVSIDLNFYGMPTGFDTINIVHTYSGDSIKFEKTYSSNMEIIGSHHFYFNTDQKVILEHNWYKPTGWTVALYVRKENIYLDGLLIESNIYDGFGQINIEEIPDSILHLKRITYSYDYLSNLNNDKEILLSPQTFKMFQNYPNPFNPITSLRYDLPNDGLVNITIYDMMGRKVKTLVNGSQTAGFKSVQWNATNDRNEPVSAGLYLYTIQAGEFRKTKKMVLLK